MKEINPNRERACIDKQITIFMGPEGSGKSTTAKRLASNANLPYITTGGIIRDMAKTDQTRYGDECRAMLTEHRYLDPKILLEIFLMRIRQDDLKEGFILDGGLRTMEETAEFGSILERADRAMPVRVVYLRIPGWMAMQRLSTGLEARNREDDSIEAVLNRLSNFYHNLGKRASFIERQPNWKLLHIDGTGTPDETYKKALNALLV